MSWHDNPGLQTLESAMQRIQQITKPKQSSEVVSLNECLGRVLTEDCYANHPLPPFNNSAMDGYAARSSDLVLNQPYSIQGAALAGKPFLQELLPNHLIRITTGAPMPVGADCVVIQEDTEQTPDGQVVINELPTTQENVRFAGEDAPSGSLLIRKNTLLRPAHLALLASTGLSAVHVRTKTRVGLIATGDELKAPTEELNYGDIYNSNGPALEATLSTFNVEVINYGIVPDNPDKLTQAFRQADSECDFVITSGGVSVGEADYSRQVLSELGEINLWRLAIKPGKPFAFGKLPNSYYIGLPGNPVSAMVTCDILAQQAIRLSQGLPFKDFPKLKAIVSHDVKKRPGRMDFQRGQWTLTNGQPTVSLTSRSQGSHILTSLAEANCYLALEKDRGHVKAGEVVTLWLFDRI